MNTPIPSTTHCATTARLLFHEIILNCTNPTQTVGKHGTDPHTHPHPGIILIHFVSVNTGKRLYNIQFFFRFYRLEMFKGKTCYLYEVISSHTTPYRTNPDSFRLSVPEERKCTLYNLITYNYSSVPHEMFKGKTCYPYEIC